ncbi:MAG: AAA family ATPase [Granulosicoccaceae bacterium]
MVSSAQAQPDSTASLKHWRERALAVERQLNQVILGQERTVRFLMLSILCRGHVLLEGDVGVGKTTLLRAAARAIGGPMERIDGSVDLMPADLLYDAYVNPDGQPVVEAGPLLRYGEDMAVFFFNEINRARPQIHATLLRLMAERSVLAFGRSASFPHLQLFADRNRLEPEETYELPAAVRDRFLFELQMNYPESAEHQLALLSESKYHDTDALIQAIDSETLPYRELRILGSQLQRSVYASETATRYALALCMATRDPELLGVEIPSVDMSRLVQAGCSPRGTSWLLRAAKAMAFLQGRSEVLPEDIREVFPVCIGHRVFLRPAYAMHHAEIAPQLVEAILRRVPAV